MQFRRYAVMGLTTIVLGVPTAAAAQHVWAGNGACYVARGGQWQPTGVSRLFPDARNANIFDLYESGRFTKRVDISDRRWHMEMPAAHFAASSHITWVAYPATGEVTPANLHVLVKSWGRWTTLEEVAAMARQRTPAWVDMLANPALAVRIVGGTQPMGGGAPIASGSATANDMASRCVSAARR